MAAHNDKLLILLMIVIFPPQCVCVVVFLPPEQQQQDVFVIFENFAARAPCVPTNCPPGYMMLTDENAGTSCYLYSNTGKSWDEAMRSCAIAPGAFLWNPNSETEANVVRSQFNLGENQGFWSGGRRGSSGKYIFEIDNLGFVFDEQNIPFGEDLSTDIIHDLTDELHFKKIVSALKS